MIDPVGDKKNLKDTFLVTHEQCLVGLDRELHHAESKYSTFKNTQVVKQIFFFIVVNHMVCLMVEIIHRYPMSN